MCRLILTFDPVLSPKLIPYTALYDLLAPPLSPYTSGRVVVVVVGLGADLELSVTEHRHRG